MITKNKDIISGIFLFLVAVFFYVGSFFIENLTGARIGPSFVPQLVSIVLAIISILIVADGIKHLKLNDSLEIEKEKKEKSGTAKTPLYKNAVLLSIINMWIYIGLMKPLGFMIMTFIYLFTQFIILSKQGKRQYLLSVIISLIVSVVTYYLFVNAFNLMLPAGILG
ncbi:MAG: tripartite tricarboxylate transporter TctB family protein [Clostridia bacterium]